MAEPQDREDAFENEGKVAGPPEQFVQPVEPLGEPRPDDRAPDRVHGGLHDRSEDVAAVDRTRYRELQPLADERGLRAPSEGPGKPEGVAVEDRALEGAPDLVVSRRAFLARPGDRDGLA